jgi:hypothetical protein
MRCWITPEPATTVALLLLDLSGVARPGRSLVAVASKVRRRYLAYVAVPVLVIGGVLAATSLASGGSSHASATRTTARQARHKAPPQLIPTRAIAHSGSGTYRDPAGWTIRVPHGWRAIRFRESKTRVPIAGAQLSNGPLRAPFVLPGYPLQVRGVDLPAGHRVGVVIGNSLWPKHPGRVLAKPPIPRFDRRNTHWLAYSTMGPGMESLWFRVHGTVFIATVTFDNGPDLGVAARMLRSLRVVPARH